MVLVVYDKIYTRLVVVKYLFSCVWAILALLPVGQSSPTVVVVAPGMVGGFNVKILGGLVDRKKM